METRQILGNSFEQVVEVGVGPKDGPGGLSVVWVEPGRLSESRPRIQRQPRLNTSRVPQ